MLGPGINHNNIKNIDIDNNIIYFKMYCNSINEISIQETHWPIAVVALPLQRWSLPFRF